MINSSWSKDILVLLSLLFSEEGKRSRGEGKSQSAIVLEIEEFICCVFRRWEIECRSVLQTAMMIAQKAGLVEVH